MTRVTIALFAALTMALGFTVTTSAQDINCGDITGDQADQILAQDPSDPNNLDADNDGFPCESNPRSGGAPATTDTGAAPAPAPAPASTTTGGSGRTSVTSAPKTGVGTAAQAGTNGAFLALLGLASIFGVAAVRGYRRA